MTRIRDIRKAVDAALDHVQAKAEAAEVQMTLGKMELEQRVEAQYGDFTRAATALQSEIEKAVGPSSRVADELRTAIDRLRVQVALGTMDSRDALESLDGDIRGRIEQFEERLDDIDLEDAVEDAADKVKEAVEHYARRAADLKNEIAARLERFSS